jgi:hypothetical protein
MDKDYTADDRVDDGAADGRPDLAALRNLWAERDRRYAMLDFPLKPGAVESVRAYRVREANDLPVGQRSVAFFEALTWTPNERDIVLRDFFRR